MRLVTIRVDMAAADARLLGLRYFIELKMSI